METSLPARKLYKTNWSTWAAGNLKKKPQVGVIPCHHFLEIKSVSVEKKNGDTVLGPYFKLDFVELLIKPVRFAESISISDENINAPTCSFAECSFAMMFNATATINCLRIDGEE